MKRSLWWLVGLAGAVLLLSACGGGAGGDKRSAVPSSDVAGTAQAAASTGTGAGEAAQKAADSALAGRSQASGAAPASGANGAPDQLAPGLDRKIVYNVFLDLVVKDVEAGFQRIAAIAEGNGGLIAESNVRQERDERRASITIRVPVARYQEVLRQARELAVKVDSERSSGNDVTEEFTDLQSRQRNLEATEQQLLVFLGQAKNIQEVLQVQDRLNSVRADVERVKGRINLLSRLSDLATIQVQLRPETPAVGVPLGSGQHPAFAALRRGWDASTAVLGTVAVAALTVAAFSWWLLPLAALALWAYRREARRRAAPEA